VILPTLKDTVYMHLSECTYAEIRML